ncbi:CCN family member 1-like [Antedon mediterranea]|uniref:CCN family member 1-like n=1 Tax=Antedon mediterranea TaxID=105859 RepID=UPI003AF7A51B
MGSLGLFVLSLISTILLAGGQCIVNNIEYAQGTSFKPSCREQCMCLENGQYGCVSMCVNEHVKPMACRSPVLIEVKNQCCREWLCEGTVEYKNTSTTKISSSSVNGKLDLQGLSGKP